MERTKRFSLVLLLSCLFLGSVVAEFRIRTWSPPLASSEQNNYLVFTETSNLASNLKILSSVFENSEEKAKKSLLYNYGIFNGFAARLTPKQASLLAKQSGVHLVHKEIIYHLDGQE